MGPRRQLLLILVLLVAGGRAETGEAAAAGAVADEEPDDVTEPTPLDAALASEEHDAKCDLWVAQAECLRNSHFMLSECRSQCTRQLVDTSGECAAWSDTGECANNPIFMALSCNASCVARQVRSDVDSRRSSLDAAKEAAGAAGSGQRGGSRAVSRAERALKDATDALLAVDEALAGGVAHAPAVALDDSDAPDDMDQAGEAAADGGWEAGSAGEDETDVDRRARAMRVAAEQHLRELRSRRADGAPSDQFHTQRQARLAAARRQAERGHGGEERADAERAEAAHADLRHPPPRPSADALEQQAREREERDSARDAHRQERLRAEAARRLGVRHWLVFRTLPVWFTFALVILAAAANRTSGKAQTAAAFAPPGAAPPEWLPAPLRAGADALHRWRVAYARAGGPPLDALARALVGMYYVNEAVAYVEESEGMRWRDALGSFGECADALQLLLPGIVACLIVGTQTAVCSALVCTDVVKDVLHVGGRILSVWWSARFFYVNELMIKKVSMLGCTLLMLASVPENRARSKSKALSGALMAEGLGAGSIGLAKSLLLLSARVRARAPRPPRARLRVESLGDVSACARARRTRVGRSDRSRARRARPRPPPARAAVPARSCSWRASSSLWASTRSDASWRGARPTRAATRTTRSGPRSSSSAWCSPSSSATARDSSAR
jgi:hypothetical protein